MSKSCLNEAIHCTGHAGSMGPAVKPENYDQEVCNVENIRNYGYKCGEGQKEKDELRGKNVGA